MTENKSKNEKCSHKQEFNLQPGFINNHGNILFYEDITKNGNKLSTYEVCRLLNQLYEENEELKKRLSDLQKDNYGNIDGIAFYQEENASLCEKISDLECENEQLKQEIQGLKDDRTRFEEETRIDAIDKALDEENEQLKELITFMGFTIKKENGNIVKLIKEDRK